MSDAGEKVADGVDTVEKDEGGSVVKMGVDRVAKDRISYTGTQCKNHSIDGSIETTLIRKCNNVLAGNERRRRT